MIANSIENPEILRRPRLSGGWITIRLTLDQKFWYAQAQVFESPSHFGIGARDNDGNWLCDPERLPASARISRLAITSDRNAWGHGPAVYNYDRGLDYDEAPAGLLDGVIGFILESVS